MRGRQDLRERLGFGLEAGERGARPRARCRPPAVSRSWQALSASARGGRRGAAAVDQRRRLGHGSPGGGDRRGRHDRAQQRFALVFGSRRAAPATGSAGRRGRGAGVRARCAAPRRWRRLRSSAAGRFPRSRVRRRRQRRRAAAVARAAFRPRRRLRSSATPLVGEPGERRLGIGEVLGLAFEVGGESARGAARLRRAPRRPG